MSKILVAQSNIFPRNKTNMLITGPTAINLLDRFRTNPIYKERSLMEENENYRQVIPYILIQNRVTGLFLFSRRTTNQSEERLHHKVGLIGGHTEYEEYTYCPVLETMGKELREETGLDVNAGTYSFCGIIVTDVQPIDRVHVGCLYHYVTGESEVYSPEADKQELIWCDMKAITDLYSRMELWSQIVVDDYICPVLN